MDFAIDATALGRPHPSGIKTILRELVPALVEQLGGDRLLLWQNDIHAPSRPIRVPRATGVRVRSSRVPPRALEALWRRLNWPPVESLTGPVDVFHSLHGRLPASRRARLVLSLNDFRHRRLPELYPPRERWNPRVIARADHFIAISENTRLDAMKFLEIPPEKITTIYLGPPGPPGSPPGGLPPGRERLAPPGPYIFCPSSDDPRKNVGCAVEAARRLRRRTGCPHRLLVVGAVHPDLAGPLRRSAGEGVVFIGRVSDPDYHSLLEGASLLVQPSLNEGFGFPVLEAFQAAVPQAVANNSALPEIAGTAALTFDPRDPEDLARTMETLIADEGLRQRLVRAGRERLREFSWESAARQTLALYRSLGAGERSPVLERPRAHIY